MSTEEGSRIESLYFKSSRKWIFLETKEFKCSKFGLISGWSQSREFIQKAIVWKRCEKPRETIFGLCDVISSDNKSVQWFKCWVSRGKSGSRNQTNFEASGKGISNLEQNHTSCENEKTCWIKFFIHAFYLTPIQLSISRILSISQLFPDLES